MDLLSTNEWDEFKSIINDAHDTFFQDTLVWYKSKGALDVHGEDMLNERFTIINLKCLFSYNYFRTWPVTQTSETGQLDRESLVVLLNKSYLNSLGYINDNGNFIFNPGLDRFLIRGVKYKAMGQTDLSQAYDTPLLFQIIMQKEEFLTGGEIN